MGFPVNASEIRLFGTTEHRRSYWPTKPSAVTAQVRSASVIRPLIMMAPRRRRSATRPFSAMADPANGLAVRCFATEGVRNIASIKKTLFGHWLLFGD
jgi:hypothetical protein